MHAPHRLPLRRAPAAPLPVRRAPSSRTCVLLLAVAAGASVAPANSTAAAPRDPLRTDAALESRATRLGLELPECGSAAAPAELGLAQAVDLALCRNPQTRIAWNQARQQAAQLGAARGAWLPTLSGSASANRSERSGVRVEATPEGPIVTSETRRQETQDAALSLSWTLWDFGARGARVEAAERLLDAAAASASGAVQGVVLLVVQAFYDVVAAEGALAAARDAERAAVQSLDVARGRLEAGVGTRAESLQAETARGQATLARVQSEGFLAGARGRLAIVLGEPADAVFAPLPEAVPERVPALAARVADLMQLAEEQRPDLAVARAQRAAAEADVRAARATGRPVLSLGAQRSISDTSGFPSQDFGAVGLSVSVPIFTGYQTRYRVRQAEAALAARDADAERVRLQVSLDVWTAYAALATAGEQLAASAALLASAAENERVALGRYEAGVGTIVDVVTAQSAAADARRQRIGAEQSWQLARAELAFATGRLASAAPLAPGGPPSGPGGGP